jgi:predicted methyltransferase
MKRTLVLATAALVAALGCVASDAQASTAVPKAIAAAVADAARPQADRGRDADRKPGECVAFSGIKQGDHVADLIPGSGYFTRIFSAVVGPKGHVYAVAPPKRPQAAADAPEPAAPVQALAADPHYGNVTVSVQRVTQLSLPEPVDMIWTSQNYHDIHNVPNVDVGDFNKAVFNALKPGGIFIVLDHAAEPGSGFRDTSTLHRIDAEAVKNEVLAAGFEYVGQSNAVHVAGDAHTLPIFDPAIRGRTDRFILKFRKPKK